MMIQIFKLISNNNNDNVINYMACVFSREPTKFTILRQTYTTTVTHTSTSPKFANTLLHRPKHLEVV